MTPDQEKRLDQVLGELGHDDGVMCRDLFRELDAQLAEALASRNAWADACAKAEVALEEHEMAEQDKLAEACAVLRLVEWAEVRSGMKHCPQCIRRPDQGHAPDCRLAKQLGTNDI